MNPKTTLPCSIVIVTFNGRHFLKDCLDAVMAQEPSPSEVVLVDNASTDGTSLWVQKEFPSVRLVCSEKNLGFAGGNNLGVAACRHNRIVLLNNDTVVQPGWLCSLVETLNEKGVGIASSCVRTQGIPEEYYERNGSLNFLGHNIMRRFSRRENLFYANGASLVFDRTEFGLPFDDAYFAYAEDVYLSLRARFAGRSIRHVQDSVVEHFGGGTGRRFIPWRMTMYQERNRLLNVLLFFSMPTVFRLLPFFVMNIAGKIGAALLGRVNLRGILSGYGWIVTHPRWIMRRRKTLAAAKKVPDEAVTGWMTSRIVNGEGLFATLTNAGTRFYCRIVGLRTLEDCSEGER